MCVYIYIYRDLILFCVCGRDWPEFLVRAADAVIKNLIEVEEDEGIMGSINGRTI